MNLLHVLLITICLLLAQRLGWARRGQREALYGCILGHLFHKGPDYGLGIVNAGIGSRGTIYIHLRHLEEEGLLLSYNEPGGPERGHLPRRLYRLTDPGAAYYLGYHERNKARHRELLGSEVRS